VSTPAAPALGPRPDFVVITGLSGSGKSQALKVFEDLGYYTLGKLPPALMATALEVCLRDGRERIAFVMDTQSGVMFAEAEAAIAGLGTSGHRPHVVFFDASDDVLLHRYSETRHRHPLDAPGGVQPSIVVERGLLVALRERADRVVDTTHLELKDLRDTLHSLYGGGASAMFVHVSSFGYKYGVPPGADLVFDVRFMENPFYLPALRPLSGSDPAVRDHVLTHAATREFLGHLMPLLRFALPRYDAERKPRLGIAFGCTGGRHRSVAIADEVAARIAAFWPGELEVEHRDRDRDRADPRT